MYEIILLSERKTNNYLPKTLIKGGKYIKERTKKIYPFPHCFTTDAFKENDVLQNTSEDKNV